MPRARPVQQERPVHERVHDHVRIARITYAEISARTKQLCVDDPWSEQKVYRLLSGKTELRAEDMETLARILEKPVAELYRDPGAAA